MRDRITRLRLLTNYDLLQESADSKLEREDLEVDAAIHLQHRPPEDSIHYDDWIAYYKVVKEHYDVATAYQADIIREIRRRDTLNVTIRQIKSFEPTEKHNIVLLEDAFRAKYGTDKQKGQVSL